MHECSSPRAGNAAAAVPGSGERRARSPRARALAAILLGLALLSPVLAVGVPVARAQVSESLLEVCAAYAQIELATRYGSPSGLVLVNDERAVAERHEGMLDGQYVATILRLDGVLTTPDGIARPVRVTCLLASVGEPVGLQLEPLR